MTPGSPPTGAASAERGDNWSRQWAQVPPEWREPVYRIDAMPFAEVFVQNKYYVPRGQETARRGFAPHGPHRFGQELAWWVFTCWREGLRRIDPADLSRIAQALPVAAEQRRRRGQRAESVLDIPTGELLRCAMVMFERRNGRLPGAKHWQNLENATLHLHGLLKARCADDPWWAHDQWDLRLDPRIPQREHEPRHEVVLKLGCVEPAWLREGLRFWMRTAITHQLFTWGTAVSRTGNLARQLGRFCLERGLVDDPLITTDPEELRSVFLDFLGHLRSPQASAKPGGLTPYTVADVQSQTQAFYTFMHDHADAAAAATGNPRWKDSTIGHTRLWSPIHQSRRGRNERELSWYSTKDLQRMLPFLDVLAARTDESVVIDHPDGTISVATGRGDPQAAKVWLLQAMTGRRASEILMLDHDPLTAIPGHERPANADADAGAFVARLRYQQTKVDGVDPTILVEQAVVDVIEDQRRWLAEQFPNLAPKHLFVGMLHKHQGRRPRPYTSYLNALRRLDKLHSLVDDAGRPLRFSQTHRLRHTRATELLNDGVPFHVVQRYLGHKSPEMTARYAATLAATAEAEFLKHKKIGAHGADLGVSPKDIYEMTQLGKRTDRALPNGVCLLPPLKSCDKGNACLSCGHFATDRTHARELENQLSATRALLAQRREQHLARTGRELGDDNIWVAERLREIASLTAILARLEDDALPEAGAVSGAATKNRLPLLQIQTRGAHETAIDHAERTRQGRRSDG